MAHKLSKGWNIPADTLLKPLSASQVKGRAGDKAGETFRRSSLDQPIVSFLALHRNLLRHAPFAAGVGERGTRDNPPSTSG